VREGFISNIRLKCIREMLWCQHWPAWSCTCYKQWSSNSGIQQAEV
jgi:hypothetical protein